MLFKNISIIDENQECKNNMYVGTIDNKIAYISSEEPSENQKQQFGEVYEGTNKLLMPAFYNAHAHCGMVMLRSRADNLPLQQWLEENNFPFEAHMTADDQYWGMLMGLAEMARYGIVSNSDMYFKAVERVQATNEAKLKVNVSENLTDFVGVQFKDHDIYDYTLDLVKNFHNTENGRILVDATLHSEYITKEQICRDVIKWASENDLILHLHLQETELETQECKQRHNGLTPTQYFNELGLFNAKVVAAHAVWVNDEDLDILQGTNATLVTCPASNMKLGSGFANIPEWFKRGINVAIGTDGACSNNNYNFLNDMYLASLISKGQYNDPCVANAKQIIYAATRGGALAQGRTDCGLIKKDFKADLCVMDLTEPIWTPETDTINNLLYAGQGSDIVLTMCDGEIIYKDGDWKTIDIEKVKYEVDSRRKRIDVELS